MPRANNDDAPPRPMTWSKAAPVLAIAFLGDALRLFFEGFWLFGPALFAFVCTAYASGTLSAWTFGLLGTGTAATACSAAAGAAGFFGFAPLEAFGVVMAMVVGGFFWLTLGLVLVSTNPRIFKANTTGIFWMILGFGVSEVPFIGGLPALTFTVAKLYRTQIKKERAARAAWEARRAARERKRREELSAQILSAQDADALAQRQAAEAANTEDSGEAAQAA